MEKFTNWRDPGTGISPFMPAKHLNKSNIIVKLLQEIINLSLFVFKLPLFLLLILIFNLSPWSSFNKCIVNIIFKYLFSGFAASSGDLVDLRVENVKKFEKSKILENLPGSNDVVVVNSSSPLDYFVLYTLSRGKFTVLTFNDKKKYINISSFGTFLKYALNLSFTEKPIASLKACSKPAPVFVFPESTPSNNNAILKFNNDESTIDLPNDGGMNLKVLSIKLLPNYLTTPVPESSVSYLYKLLTNSKSLRFKVHIASASGFSKWSDIRAKLSDISGLKLVANDVQSKKSFIKSFHSD